MAAEAREAVEALTAEALEERKMFESLLDERVNTER